MMPRELTSDLPLGYSPSGYEALQYYRILLRYLADHAHEAQLNDGSYLAEPTKIRTFMREILAELPSAARSTRLEVTARPKPQPRWDECPRCGHVHEGIGECGVQMGGGGLCRCEMEVAV